MTPFELISTAFSALAVGLSIYTFLSNRKLQHVTAELAKKQLQSLARDERDRGAAQVQIYLIKEDLTSFRFVIRNVGAVEARNVNLTLLLDDPKLSPLIGSECKEKLPFSRLSPGSSFTLIAALHLGSPLAYRASLEWMNPDGTRRNEEVSVSL